MARVATPPAISVKPPKEPRTDLREKLLAGKEEKKPEPPKVIAKNPNDNDGEDSTEEGEILDDDEKEEEEEGTGLRKEAKEETKSEVRSSSSSSRKICGNHDKLPGETSRKELRSPRKRSEPESKESGAKRNIEPSKSGSEDQFKSSRKVDGEGDVKKDLNSPKDNQGSKDVENNPKKMANVSQGVEANPVLKGGVNVTRSSRIDAHSEEANDGFVVGAVGGGGGGEEKCAAETSAAAAQHNAIPVPVSDMNTVDLDSMIEKKQKNLQVCCTIYVRTKVGRGEKNLSLLLLSF